MAIVQAAIVHVVSGLGDSIGVSTLATSEVGLAVLLVNLTAPISADDSDCD
jgi:hypothetical protein